MPLQKHCQGLVQTPLCAPIKLTSGALNTGDDTVAFLRLPAPTAIQSISAAVDGFQTADAAAGAMEADLRAAYQRRAMDTAASGAVVSVAAPAGLQPQVRAEHAIEELRPASVPCMQHQALRRISLKLVSDLKRHGWMLAVLHLGMHLLSDA